MGLFKTAARSYVATRVITSTHRRQQQRWAQEDAVSAQQAQVQSQQVAPSAADTPSTLDQLTQLGQLRDAGVLTDVEFEQKKQLILAGNTL